MRASGPCFVSSLLGIPGGQMSLVLRHSNFGGIAAAEDEDPADNQSATFGVRTSAVAATSLRDFPECINGIAPSQIKRWPY